MPRHVLVPVDGSPQSLQAIGFVSAEWDDVDVTLLHVINPVQAGYRAGVLPSGSEEWFREAKSEAEEILDEARAQLEVGGDVETAIEVGRPAATIVDVADDDAPPLLRKGEGGGTSDAGSGPGDQDDAGVFCVLHGRDFWRCRRGEGD